MMPVKEVPAVPLRAIHNVILIADFSDLELYEAPGALHKSQEQSWLDGCAIQLR
jgi:hypothetical protein